MIKAIQIYLSLIRDRFLSLGKYIILSLRFITPYVILLLTQIYGFCFIYLLLPLVVWVITSVFDIYLSNKGLGSRIPKPIERFTEDIGDGEIVIRNDRLQELILYTNDLENWLRANGYTDK